MSKKWKEKETLIFSVIVLIKSKMITMIVKIIHVQEL